MDFWKCIEILKLPNKSQLSLQDNTEDKINALKEIAYEGYPSLAECLMEFLKDDNKEVREAVCQTIIYLFRKITSKKSYYDTLRYCNISKSDIDYYKATFTSEQYTELLAISSLNHSGYIREKAVQKLTEADNARALQFLIYRLADWVLPVRQAALKGIEGYKSARHVDSLIDNLPVFAWLHKVERVDMREIYHDIIDFIVSANRDHVIKHFKTYNDKLRVILARHISDSADSSSSILKLFLRDKHFLIRSLAINSVEQLGHDDIQKLLHDKSAKVRLYTLYRLKDQSDFAKIVHNYLADESATIRYFARFTLKTDKAELAAFYNQSLQERRQVVGALRGLSELAAKQYSETVKVYLNDKEVKISKTAFSSMQELDEEGAYTFALVNLDSPIIGLRKMIIDFLSSMPRQEALDKARDIYITGNYELKRSMLHLFHKVGGWATIADLIFATIDENESIRQLGLQYLEIWRVKATKLYNLASAEQVARVKRSLLFANEIHRDKQYFDRNVLEGLEFYFK